MNKFMKRLAKDEGFTLVELIVVIAILAILAGVATAGYSGYIKSANDAAVLSDMDAILTAATAANATAGEVQSITINVTGDSVTIVAKTSLAKNFKSDFETFFTGASVTMPAAGATDAAARTATVSIPAIGGWANSKYGDATTAGGAIWTSTTSEWAVAPKG